MVNIAYYPPTKSSHPITLLEGIMMMDITD